MTIQNRVRPEKRARSMPVTGNLILRRKGAMPVRTSLFTQEELCLLVAEMID